MREVHPVRGAMFIAMGLSASTSQFGRADMKLNGSHYVECPPVRTAIDFVSRQGYKHCTPTE
jgi:hypothetical protein